LGNPGKYIPALLQHFSRLQDEDVSPVDYQLWVDKEFVTADTPELVLEKQKYTELALLYSRYQDLKIGEGWLDFSDLISYTLQLFKTRQNILHEYQKKYKYVLVDEFQDTNYSQNCLVNLLAGNGNHLTVVADDDQSIYRWRGAAISNVIKFKTVYPNCQTIVLTDNFRSTQSILDRSYDLIQYNNPDRLEVRESISKKLNSARGVLGPPISLMQYSSSDMEAEGVVTKISQLLKDEKYPLAPSDIAILVRANAHAAPFLSALNRFGIPAQFLGPGKLYEQPEVKDLLAYLKLLHDPYDDQALFRLLTIPAISFSSRTLILLNSLARKNNLSLYELIKKVQIPDALPENISLPILSEQEKKLLTKIMSILDDHLSRSRLNSVGSLLYQFMDESGILSAILKQTNDYDERKARNISKFFSRIKEYELNHSEISVSDLLSWIELSSQVGESPSASVDDWSENNAVSILTVHSAKGLEFPVVFMVNLVTQRFPSTAKAEPIPIPAALIKEELPSGDYHLQEERRLFYVGMTRAKDLLYFTYSTYYGEGKRPRKISPFIIESLGIKVTPQSQTPPQLSLLDWTPVTPPVATSTYTKPKIDYLSYSQIQTFIDCPMHYRAKYILKIPSPPSAASSFGNTIHRTLKDYYEAVRRDESPAILEIYHRNWISQGYTDKRHESLYLAKGEKYLTDYLKLNPPTRLPSKLEENFIIPLSGIKIGGKIDRVDILPNGRLEIIDYKTSTHHLTEKEASKDLQLSFYALAATNLNQPPFGCRPEDIVLSLYYFDQQKKVSVTQSAAQLQQAKLQILEYTSKIEDSDYRCSGSIICKDCDFKILCDIDTGSA
jgi:DNA helicase-2/ATP-dependent DNA helicase PcrA